MFMSVLLPAPFSPTSAWISPCRTCKSTWSLATTPGKFLTMARISTASPPGEQATHDHGAVAKDVDIDPGGVGRLRVLPDSANPQAQSRPKEHDLRGDQNDQGHVNHDVLLEENRSNEWQAVQQRNVQVRQRIVRGDVAHVGEAVEPVDQEDGDAA